MKRGRADAPALSTPIRNDADLIPDPRSGLAGGEAQNLDARRQPFAESPRTLTDDRIYNATPDGLIKIMSENRKAQSLIIVGHNPSTPA